MENQYKKLFDSVAPIKSDEELLRAVLDRKAKNMSSKKKISKKTIFIPVAAALLGTTAIGVSAAYQWNLPSAFEDLFRNRYEEYNGIEEAGPRRDAFDFSVIGKELFLYYNFGDFDVAIRGIAADEHSVFLLYDVDFAEDYDYALEDGEEWFLNLRPVTDLSWVMSYDGNMAPSVDWQNRLINMEGRRAHCCSSISISGISLQDKALVYTFDSLIRSSDGEEDAVELEEKKFSVDMDFRLSKNSVKLRPNEAVTLAGGETGKVDYIGLSTFGLELHAEWDDDSIGEEDMCEKLKSSVTVNYKDGTTSDSSAFTAGYVGSTGTWNSMEDGYSSSILLSWLYPVYMEDIESVTVGDKTFRLDSAFSAPAFDFESIGKEINRSYEFEDYTLNVRGLITDGYSAYIVCDVVFDEDFDYAPKDGWYDWELSVDSDLPGGSGHPGTINGNVYTFYHEVGTIDNTTLQGKTVTFDFEWLRRMEMSRHVSEKDETPEELASETLDCGVTLAVDFDFDVTRGNKTVTGSRPIYLSELFGSGTLSEFAVTPLGIKATVENSDIESAISVKAETNDFDLALYHADGSVSLIESYGRLDGGTLYLEGYFDYPLDTSDIVSAKIGSVEVDLHSGRFTSLPTENAAPEYDFNSLGTAIGDSWEGKGYKFTIDGVVADPHVANFIYTVEFNDEFPYDYAHMDVYGVGWFDWQVNEISATVNGEEANIGVEMHGTDQVWLDDNTLRGGFTIFCDDMSFENSEMTVSVGELRHQHTSEGGIDHERRVDCGLTAGFTLGDMSGLERSVALNETMVANDGITKAVLTEINITPFKLNYTLKSVDGTKINYVNFVRPDEYVTLKDGTRISATGGGASFGGGLLKGDSRLSYPVHPADVASVSICGREIDLSAEEDDAPENYNAPEKRFDFSQLDGKELGRTIEGKGFTLTVDKVVADIHNAHILYTLRFDEDTDYASGTPSNWSFNYGVKLDGKAVGYGGRSVVPYLEDGALKGEIVLRFGDCDLTDKTLTLCFNTLDYSKTTLSPLGEQHISFIENVDIAMDFDLRSDETLTLTPNVAIEVDGLIAVLSEVTVTPFGMNNIVTLPMEQLEDPDKYFEFLGRVREALGEKPVVTFADGSVEYDLTNVSAGDTIENSYYLTRPIDTSAIKSITFGGYTINIG